MDSTEELKNILNSFTIESINNILNSNSFDDLLNKFKEAIYKNKTDNIL